MIGLIMLKQMHDMNDKQSCEQIYFRRVNFGRLGWVIFAS